MIPYQVVVNDSKKTKKGIESDKGQLRKQRWSGKLSLA